MQSAIMKYLFIKMMKIIKKGFYYYFGKRLMDLIVSIVAIVILLIPMIAIGIIIKLDSKGPVFYKSKRLGRDKKPFTFYKFRSMKTDTPHDIPSIEIDANQYVTNFGKFIRKSSIDELPQLFNVVIGQMSIVGPRPIVSSEKNLIQLREANNIYSIKPGITGLAQINGRDFLSFDLKKKVEFESIYIEKISFFFDFKIILMTILYIFSSKDIMH